jgi:hypothetical protein
MAKLNPAISPRSGGLSSSTPLQASLVKRRFEENHPVQRRGTAALKLLLQFLNE